MINKPALVVSALLLGACGQNQTIPAPGTYEPGDVVPLSCVPNLDGVLVQDELPAALGITASFLVSPVGAERDVELEGGADAAGHRVWDMSERYLDDQVARIGPSGIVGKWYEAEFAGAEFVAPISADGSIEGVYAYGSDEFLFLGYASRDFSNQRTLIVYSPPVALYRFPLEVGRAWTSEGNISDGLVAGLPYVGVDTYEQHVEAAGQLLLPDVTFTQALQVRTRVTIDPAVGMALSRRQVGWLFECYGEVERATSRNNETAEDFAIAAELRRIGLQ